MRIELHFIISFALSLLSAKSVSCWRLDALGIDESKVEISRIAVYGNRAFVAMPRVGEDQRVTLAELPWPERSLTTPFNTKPFPNLESQNGNDCENLQSVTTLDLDKSGRLYVLDQGSSVSQCPPKIVVYDVSGKELLKRELSGLSISNQTSLVVDTGKSRSTDLCRVILGDAGNNNSSLLLYDFDGQGWWKLTVTGSAEVEDNFVMNDDEAKFLSFNQLAISKSSSTLYATSAETRELYSIDLESLRNMDVMPEPDYEDDAKATEVPVKYIGNKFGPSAAVYVDFRGNLYYVYTRDHVALKFNLDRPFVDEYADVLLQDEGLLPSVVQIFSGPAYQVWALNSRKNSQASYTVKLKLLRFIGE